MDLIGCFILTSKPKNNLKKLRWLKNIPNGFRSQAKLGCQEVALGFVSLVEDAAGTGFEEK
jgi:hypothetical protein